MNGLSIQICVLCGSHDHMQDQCFWRPGWASRSVSERSTVTTTVTPTETIDVHVTVTTAVTPSVNPTVPVAV